MSYRFVRSSCLRTLKTRRSPSKSLSQLSGSDIFVFVFVRSEFSKRNAGLSIPLPFPQPVSVSPPSPPPPFPPNPNLCTHPISQLEKLAYNQKNAYFGVAVPLLTYIYVRNLTPFLRTRYLEPLHSLGKITLETYLMQHHIWLTSNAKTLLVVVPGHPKLNMVVVTVSHVLVSRELFRLTMSLRGMCLPDDLGACLRNLTGIAATIGAAIAVAKVRPPLALPDIGNLDSRLLPCFLPLPRRNHHKSPKYLRNGRASCSLRPGVSAARASSEHSALPWSSPCSSCYPVTAAAATAMAVLASGVEGPAAAATAPRGPPERANRCTTESFWTPVTW